jgi:hypothetical protein
MVLGLGYSNTDFETAHPGRLCRGRERWIQRWEDPGCTLKRLVISGAAFSDDSARDAVRGLTCISVDIGRLVRTLFPEERLVAFKEEGQLPDVPGEIGDEGQYWAPRDGGRVVEPCQRWTMEVTDDDVLSELIAGDGVDGFLVAPELPLVPALQEAVYLLTGQGDDSKWPVARFQPLAMAEILDHCKALICVHQDKHGPAIGVYSREEMDSTAELRALAVEANCLPVPFAIPPMLARWDRALYELRVGWDEEELGEFPVPPASEASRWGGRRPRSKQQSQEE